MAQCERVSGALDATQVHTPGARGHPCGEGAWPACRPCATLVRALGTGFYPSGWM